MSVSGNLGTMVMADLIQWLAFGRKTGCLCMEGTHFDKKIWFRDGIIVAAESMDPRDLLGQLLLRKGVLTDEELSKALETQKKTGISLGRILSMIELLDEEQTKAVLREQIEEIIYSVFLWDHGAFHFKDNEEPTSDKVKIKLDAMEVVMEGARRRDEWIDTRELFPEGAIIRMAGPLIFGHLDADSPAAKVVDLLQEEMTFEQFCLNLRTSDCAVVRQLHDMYRNGIVEAIEPDSSTEDEAATDKARSAVPHGKKHEPEDKYERSLLHDELPLEQSPALIRASRLSAYASRVGITWSGLEPILDLVNDEMEELTSAVLDENKSRVKVGLGNVLFDLATLAGYLEVDSEDTLHRACDSFTTRVKQIVEGASRSRGRLKSLDADKFDELWSRTKVRQEDG